LRHRIIHISMLLIIGLQVFGQSLASFGSSDPHHLLLTESQQLGTRQYPQSLDIRPLIPEGPESGFNTSVWAQSSLFHNDNAPNLENTSELWVGKGWTTFTSLQLEVQHRYLYFTIQPYYQYSQNQPFTYYHVSWDPDKYGELVRKFHVLNDGPGRGEEAVSDLKLRETQLYLHWKGLGGGFSNSGMWWGPGIQSSLNMTTNTSGLPRIVLGTVQEQRLGKFGLVGQYIFSKLDKNVTEPYYTAVNGSITYYSDPIITLGGSRTFLSGGNYAGEDVSWRDAVLLPFQAFRKEKLYDPETGENPSDRTDQTLSLFLSMVFPESGLKIFLEYGWNDHRWDWYDLRAHPDHSGASIIGFRKYGLFGNQHLHMGFEYANLMKSPYYPLRATPDWYGRRFFDYSLYDGRRFGAHSGSDSDDMLLYLGYADQKQGGNLGFNYERHGKIYSVTMLDYSLAGRFPEGKLELRLDYWRDLSFGRLFAYYEYEFTENLGSPPQGVFPRVDNPERKANVIGLGLRSRVFDL